MENRKVKVGVVQATPALFNIEKTIEIVISWIEKAAKEGCELLLFPESFIPCYPRGLTFDAVIGRRSDKSRDQWLKYWNSSLDLNSESKSAKHLSKLIVAIKKANIFVALGVTEKETLGGSLHCSLLYFGKDGCLLGKHR